MIQQAIRLVRITTLMHEAVEAEIVDSEMSDPRIKAEILLELNALTLKLYDIKKVLQREAKKK